MSTLLIRQSILSAATAILPLYVPPPLPLKMAATSFFWAADSVGECAAAMAASASAGEPVTVAASAADARQKGSAQAKAARFTMFIFISLGIIPASGIQP